MKEAASGSVELQCTSADGMEAILDFIYSGTINLNLDNVFDILKGTDFFMMTHLQEYCESYLQGELNSTNCLQMKKMAEQFRMKSLSAETQKVLGYHFSEIMRKNEDDMLRLSADELCSIISNEGIQIREEDLFDFLMKWVIVERRKRKSKFPELMSHIRLGHVDKKFLLDRVEVEPLVKASPECKMYVMEATRFHLANDDDNSDNIRLQLRCEILIDVILVCCGITFERTDRTSEVQRAMPNMLGYILSKDQWVTLPSADTVLPVTSPPLSVALNNNLVLISNTTTAVYNPLQNKWDYTIYTPSLLAHTFGAAVVCNNKIYVIGGESNPKSIEMLNPHTNRWMRKRSSPEAYVTPDVVVVNDRYIYLYVRHHPGVINRYDTREDKWSSEDLNIEMDDLRRTQTVFPSIGRRTPDGYEINDFGSFKMVYSAESQEFTLSPADNPPLENKDFQAKSAIIDAAVCVVNNDGDVVEEPCMIIFSGSIED
ncbi:kelch-like protein 11 [Glandiceps talaboti]